MRSFQFNLTCAATPWLVRMLTERRESGLLLPHGRRDGRREGVGVYWFVVDWPCARHRLWGGRSHANVARQVIQLSFLNWNHAKTWLKGLVTDHHVKRVVAR